MWSSFIYETDRHTGHPEKPCQSALSDQYPTFYMIDKCWPSRMTLNNCSAAAFWKTDACDLFSICWSCLSFFGHYDKSFFILSSKKIWASQFANSHHLSKFSSLELLCKSRRRLLSLHFSSRAQVRNITQLITKMFCCGTNMLATALRYNTSPTWGCGDLWSMQLRQAQRLCGG